MTTEKKWIFYIICNEHYTYAGVSPDPTRRLRQHNGEICGGAKYTTRKGKDWYPILIIDGFETMKEAMQCEWKLKHNKKFPADPNTLNYLGFTHRKVGDYENAEIYYSMGLELDPKHVGINEYMGELFVVTNRLDKAKERLAAGNFTNELEKEKLTLIANQDGIELGNVHKNMVDGTGIILNPNRYKTKACLLYTSPSPRDRG